MDESYIDSFKQYLTLWCFRYKREDLIFSLIDRLKSFNQETYRSIMIKAKLGYIDHTLIPSIEEVPLGLKIKILNFINRSNKIKTKDTLNADSLDPRCSSMYQTCIDQNTSLNKYFSKQEIYSLAIKSYHIKEMCNFEFQSILQKTFPFEIIPNNFSDSYILEYPSVSFYDVRELISFSHCGFDISTWSNEFLSFQKSQQTPISDIGIPCPSHPNFLWVFNPKILNLVVNSDPHKHHIEIGNQIKLTNGLFSVDQVISLDAFPSSPIDCKALILVEGRWITHRLNISSSAIQYDGSSDLEADEEINISPNSYSDGETFMFIPNHSFPTQRLIVYFDSTLNSFERGYSYICPTDFLEVDQIPIGILYPKEALGVLYGSKGALLSIIINSSGYLRLSPMNFEQSLNNSERAIHRFDANIFKVIFKIENNLLYVLDDMNLLSIWNIDSDSIKMNFQFYEQYLISAPKQHRIQDIFVHENRNILIVAFSDRLILYHKCSNIKQNNCIELSYQEMSILDIVITSGIKYSIFCLFDRLLIWRLTSNFKNGFNIKHWTFFLNENINHCIKNNKIIHEIESFQDSDANLVAFSSEMDQDVIEESQFIEKDQHSSNISHHKNKSNEHFQTRKSLDKLFTSFNTMLLNGEYILQSSMVLHPLNHLESLNSLANEPVNMRTNSTEVQTSDLILNTSNNLSNTSILTNHNINSSQNEKGFGKHLSEMQKLFGNDRSEAFQQIKIFLAVYQACFQIPTTLFLSVVLDKSIIDIELFVTHHLSHFLYLIHEDNKTYVRCYQEKEELLYWIVSNHAWRIARDFWVDISLGHNLICAIYLKYCGNKSIAIEHPWQIYLQNFGCSHLRATSRGLRLLTIQVRKLDETANIRQTLPRQIGYISGLQEIYARRVGLCGKIPKEIGLLTNLRVLSMGNNRLSGELPNTIKHLKNLQRIVIHQNNLIGLVPPELGDLGCIVNLAGNPRLEYGDDVSKIERDTLVDLFYSTKGLNWTTKTNWASEKPVCNWYKVGVLSSHVHSLVMSSNGMDGTIPKSIKHLKYLRMIELATMPGLSGCLPKELFGLNSLRRLCICRCGLLGEIPEEIGNLVNLEELQLFGNKLHGSIPQSLGKLVNLKLLSLGEYTGGNNFNPEPIPFCITKLRNLEALFLANCNIKGTIPSWIGELTELRQLDLQKNHLYGNIPRNIRNLENLLYLNMKDNPNLGGPLPLTELLSLTRLNRLSLVHCNFQDIDQAYETLKQALPRCKIWL